MTTRPAESPALATPTTALASSGARVLLIGTGTHDGPTLTSVPAVPRSVEALAAVLAERCGVTPDRLRTLVDPADARTMALAVADAAQEAESTLLVYYVGHGLIGPGDELYLAATATDRLTPGLAAHQALSFSALREALTLCRAASVIVVLDCCFSGRARLGAGTPQPAAFTLPAGHGMYLMGSAEQLALAPDDAEHTALTGELISLLRDGDPRAPRLLTLDDVYDHLFRALRSRGGPLPRRQAGDRSGGLVLAVNAAAPATDEPDGTTAEEPAPGPCPYPGLDAFTVDDAEFFHGREKLVDELLRGCLQAVEQGRPLAVVGPSGAGKTSLLHAGLLAALQAGTPLLPGSAAWPGLVLTPGEHPLRNLTTALRGDTVLSAEDPKAAVGWVHDLVPDRRRLVLVVDQLEELFTLCRSRTERTAFLAALAALAEAGTLVVAALRADFYGHAQALPELDSMLRSNQVLVSPMRQEELRAAIERPAAAVGLELDEGLADLLIHELGAARLTRSQTGTLPLLSHALWSTWRHRQGRQLTVAGYRDSGGIDEAIKQTADDTYEHLDDAGRAAVRRMLPRLVHIDDDAPDTSRPADRTVLLDGLPDPQAAERALNRLAAARLLVLDEHTVRISHNALLHTWPRLREWIDADRDWLRARQQVAVDAAVWWEADRHPSLLYRGPRLAATRERLEGAGLTAAAEGKGHAGELEPRLAEFLNQSWRQERRGVRIRRAVIACMCVLTLLAGAGGGLAWWSGQKEAAQRREAVARLVNEEADRLRDSRPGLAKQLSLIANRLDPQIGTASMLAEMESPGVFMSEASADDISLDARGERMAVSTGSDVVLWDTAHGNGKLGNLGQMRTGAVALSPDGRLVAVVRAGSTASGSLGLWDIARRSVPRPLRTLSGHTGNVDSLTFAPSGRLLASAGSDGKVRLWDMTDQRRTSASAVLPGLKLDSQTYDLNGKPLHRVAFSPDGRLLAGPGDGDKTRVRLWRLPGRGQPTSAGTAKDKYVTDCAANLASAAFSPDGKVLATGCDANTYLWDVLPGSRLRQSAQLKRGAEANGTGPALFTAHGHRLLRATGRGVLLWYVENTAQPTAAASFGPSPSGFQVTTKLSGGARRLLVIHGANGGALWDLTGTATLHKSLARLPGSGEIGAEGAAFSPDGKILALSELSGNKRVVRLRDTRRSGAPVIATITDIANGVEDLSFSADGHLLAVADNNDNTAVRAEPPSVKLFDVTTVSHPRRTAAMKGNVFFVTFSPKDRLLVANTADRMLSWTVANPRRPVPQLTRWLTPGADVSRTAFRPDGELLAATDTKSTTRFWRIKNGRITGDPSVMRTIGSGGGIAFSPDGGTLAWSSTGDPNDVYSQNHIEMWDVSHWKAPVYKGAFAFDLGSLTGFGSLSYSSHGKPLLAAAGADINVWATNTPDLKYLLCKNIGDRITEPEWNAYVPGEPYDPPCD
ncbi:caspase family protein [Streptomyces sp. Ag109_G2-15]|uniref:caspase, EACC1-associated type n=1 Tax=Streptomyces sp. Ag109_G2-15 TaxID=1938850 RepID=UPI000BD74464|nr:caspase family protein [Streptomyces sp. Ag109_G2-15]SOD87478.1 WD40 repeat [Streptomyces sp. Ag109_G2-15]